MTKEPPSIVPQAFYLIFDNAGTPCGDAMENSADACDALETWHEDVPEGAPYRLFMVEARVIEEIKP